MTEKKSTHEQKSQQKESSFLTKRWFSALTQLIGTIGSLAVFVVMLLQFWAIRQEQKLSLRPYITINEQTLFLDEKTTGQENEMWVLNYLIINTGSYPALNVKYKIEHTSSKEFGIPSSFDNEGELIIPPNGGTYFAAKNIPRSEVLRIQSTGDLVYKHVYIRYQDGFGKMHYTSSSWVLTNYSIGVLPVWTLIQSGGN